MKDYCFLLKAGFYWYFMINDVYVELKSAFFPQYKLNVFVNIIIKETNRPVSQSEPVLFSG